MFTLFTFFAEGVAKMNRQLSVCEALYFHIFRRKKTIIGQVQKEGGQRIL
jgi:hypothetical protein